MPATSLLKTQLRVVPVDAGSVAPAAGFEIKCSGCNRRERCLPQGLGEADLQRLEGLVYTRRRVKRGETLFGAGDAFHSVYSVRSGFFKTTTIDNEGREQVTGFN